jgi:hypothetical protein
MRKTALVLILLAAMAASAFADYAVGNYSDAKAQAAKADKPLLVDFFTEW